MVESIPAALPGAEHEAVVDDGHDGNHRRGRLRKAGGPCLQTLPPPHLPNIEQIWI